MSQEVKFVSNYVVYGSNDMTLTPNFVHLERIEKSRLKNRGEVRTHVHSNIFQCLYISQGNVEFESRRASSTVGESSFIVIPEDTLHSVRFNTDTKGVVITVSQLLLHSLFQFNHEVPDIFKSTSILQAKNHNYINVIIDQLEQQLTNMLEPHEVTVRALLTLIIKELYQLLKGEKLIRNRKIKVNDSHFTKFIKLIRENAGAETQLQDYAHQLGITSTHLNRICKMTVGKTASSVINDYIILEAKRYLTFTSHSIAEIAFMLEFSTPSYFNRYFKKSVGMTPRSYRLSVISDA